LNCDCKPQGTRAKDGSGRPCWRRHREKALKRDSRRAQQKVCFPHTVIRPTLTFIAGANGAGKTTLTRWNAELFKEIPLLDPDAIANTLQNRASALFPVAAARQVLNSAEAHLKNAESFAVETTLAGKNYLQMMLDARNRGFEIVLVYIGTENVEINLGRIRNRVLAGGHDVPDEDVRRRYKRSFENLPIAITRADHAILFDNSTDDGYRLIAILGAAGNQWFEPKPPWLIRSPTPPSN
jgi:predicted ABC-type ATPase